MKEFGAIVEGGGAMRNGNYGDCITAHAEASASLAEVPDGWNRDSTALALAQCGDITMAEKLITALDKEHPEDTLIHTISIPIVRAFAELQRGNAAAGVAGLEAGRPYELGAGPGGYPPYPLMYGPGVVYLRVEGGGKTAGGV